MSTRAALSAVALCLVFTLTVALPFQPWAASRSGACAFEVTVESDESGLATLFFDVGSGGSAVDSAVQPVSAGHLSTLRFALPSGRLRSLSLAPLDRDVRMTLSDARIADGSGRTLARFAPERLQPANQIESMVVRNEKVLVSTSRNADRPLVRIGLTGPLALPRSNWWLPMALVFASLLAAYFAFEWMGRSQGATHRRRAAVAWEAARASPGRAILAAALLGTIAANYPVIFAGRSLVSPNLGTALLYGQLPWVPGFQSLERGNSNSADIDALMWHHLPLSMVQHRAAFGDGELPLWNRYDSAGTPLLGQGQSCFGDPLHLIPFLANGAPWAWDLKFLLAKVLFACGIGFSVWRLTRHLPASLLMAVSVQFIGFFVYRVNHPAIFSLCYAPWILYAWIRIVEAGAIRASILWMVALLAANLAELCSGTAKEAYILLVSCNFSGVLMLAGCRRSLADKVKLLGAASVETAAFAMMSSPVWYTFFRALKNSYTTYGAVQTFQLQPGMFAGLFDELFFRPFQFFGNVINPSANFFILVGLIWAAVRSRSLLNSRCSAALLVSTLPALALVFGVIPPGFVARIPYLGNILHVDNTFSCVLIVMFAVLAGVGWKEALERIGSRDGKWEAGVVMVVLIGIYAAYLGTAQAVVRGYYFDRTWGKLIELGPFIHLYALSLLAAAALLLWVARKVRERGPWSAELVLLGTLSFAALHWRHGLQAGMAFPEYVIMPASRVDLLAHSPAVEAVSSVRDLPSRSVGFVDSFFPGWSAAYGLEGISGPDALMNRYYRQLMDVSGIERVWDWRYKLEDRDLGAVKPMLDLLNVRFYLDYPAGRRAPREMLSPFSSSDMEVYESRSYWPRAFFTDSIAVYRDLPQYWSWIRAGDGRPFAAIEHGDWDRLNPLPAISGDLSTRRINPARDYVLTANTTSFTVDATGPGLIVLTEAYERGNFRATLNGVDVPYSRVNHAFKGIFVGSAGRYTVRFSYWPDGFSITLVVMGMGILVVLVGLSLVLLTSKTPPLSRPFEI